jgi:UDP:flavonoid glycosyltransferase YjiC (YdhE family)
MRGVGLSVDRDHAHIVVTGFGSIGDMAPLVSLGGALRDRGHRVVIASAHPFRDAARKAGLEFSPIRPHLLPDEMLSLAMSPDTTTEVLFRDVLFPSIGDSFDDLMAATESADVLISHMLACAAPLVAAARPIAWVSAVLQPLGFGSDSGRIVSFSEQSESGLEQLDAATSHRAWRQARRDSDDWAAPVRELRTTLGLPEGRNPIFDDHHSPSLVLGLFSKLLAAECAPTQSNITGFVFDGPSGDRLPQTLELFLSRGAPPVVVTLGSHSPFDSFGFHVTSAIAAVALGRRVVLLGRGTQAHVDTLRAINPVWADSVRAYEFVPYDLVFPRAAAVIHHGGVGTIAACMRAGTPMLLVPMGFDQLHNAWQANDLGSVRSIGAPSYSVVNAARQLAALLQDPRCAHAAAQLSRAVREEDGRDRACEKVEMQWRRAST